MPANGRLSVVALPLITTSQFSLADNNYKMSVKNRNLLKPALKTMIGQNSNHIVEVEEIQASYKVSLIIPKIEDQKLVLCVESFF